MDQEAIWAEYIENCSLLDWEPPMLSWIQSIRDRGLADDALACLRAKWNKSYNFVYQNDWDRVYTRASHMHYPETALLMTMTELGDKRALRLLVVLEWLSGMCESIRVIVRHMDDTVLEALQDGVNYQLPEAALTVRAIRQALAKENLHHPLFLDLCKLCERFEITERPYGDAVRFTGGVSKP